MGEQAAGQRTDAICEGLWKPLGKGRPGGMVRFRI